MKIANLLLFSILLSSACAAQGVFSNQTNKTLEKVVQDYPSQFKNIRGNLLSSAPGTTAYQSNIVVPGSISTTIVQSAGPASTHKETISWQSVLYAGNEFKNARNRFEELFNQIKNTIIKAEGEKAVIVNGMFINPSEDKNFTTVQFDLLPASGLMQKVNIDLLLEHTGPQWKIILSVYDKDRKDVEMVTAR